MLKFLQKILDTPDKKAFRDLRNAERDIDKAGGYFSYLESFINAYIRNDASYVFFFCGVTLDGTENINSAALRLACLKHLHKLRTEKLATDTQAVLKLLENAEELSVEMKEGITSMGQIEKDSVELRATRNNYAAAGLFLQPIEMKHYESSSEFKEIYSGTLEDARKHAVEVLGKKIIMNDIQGIRKEPLDIVESVASEDRVVEFFRTKALDRADIVTASFDEWVGAELRTLSDLVRRL